MFEGKKSLLQLLALSCVCVCGFCATFITLKCHGGMKTTSLKSNGVVTLLLNGHLLIQAHDLRPAPFFPLSFKEGEWGRPHIGTESPIFQMNTSRYATAPSMRARDLLWRYADLQPEVRDWDFIPVPGYSGVNSAALGGTSEQTFIGLSFMAAILCVLNLEET